MADEHERADHELPAGDFSAWVIEVQGAMRGENAAAVPCDGCTACCTASQFIHIGPEETDALAHIPKELLFPAPRMPRGHVLMGYDERGHCPMLIDNRCSIYEHRPRTCRTYDCRVFPAAGVEPDDADKALIAQRAQRWRFTYRSPSDRVEHAAVRAAASYLDANRATLPNRSVPNNATQLAVAAIDVHDAFLARDEAGVPTAVVEPDPSAVAAKLTRDA